ncbi:MAG: hypothetical protein PWQ97_1533 [Tepidanaerobacteraceae bacterium]|nr:hypothetical protein [Tepidanaerobacteraceae bacterium]
MKKFLALIMMFLLILTSSSIVFARGNETKHQEKNQIQNQEQSQIIEEEEQEKSQDIENNEDITDNQNISDSENKDGNELKLNEKATEKLKNEIENRIANQGDESNLQIEEKLRELKSDFKNSFRDKEKRKEILKQIYELKKQQNNNAISVFVNGDELKFDVPPVIKEGRVLIPVKAVVSALGAEVKWDPETKTVTITKDGKTIILQLESKTAIVDGQEVELDVPAGIQNGRTIVPLRFIMQAFNSNVEWDGEDNTVIIDDSEQDITDSTDETPSSEIAPEASESGTTQITVQ